MGVYNKAIRKSKQMEEKRVKVETFIKEELEREAEEIRQERALSEEAMPAEAKERIRKGLEEKIEDYELGLCYPELSEEDRKALRLGHKMLEKDKAGVKGMRRKRGIKFYVGLAAVLMMVLGVGAVSLGGPERIVRLMKSAIGGREVEQADSSEENLIIVEEDEKKAYQVIKEELGVEPVRIIKILEDDELVFDYMEFDRELQIAEFNYSYNGEKLIYFMNASFKDASWAIDMDDNFIEEYQVEREGCPIDIKEYAVEGMEKKKYLVSFQYKGLEYFIFGTMDQGEMETIVEELHFY